MPDTMAMRIETRLEKVERLIEQARLRRERERERERWLTPLGVVGALLFWLCVVAWLAQNMTLTWVVVIWGSAFVVFAVRLASFLLMALAALIVLARGD